MTTLRPDRRFAISVLTSFLWALVGSACATGTWATLNGVYAAVRGSSLEWFASGFVGGLYFGGFVALLLLVPYWGLLLAFVALIASRPSFVGNANRFMTAAFLLALPGGIVVFLSFLAPWSPLGPFWDPAVVAGPMALLSTWCGLVAPVFLVPFLRRRASWVAA
jgi:hypothetical protein